MDTNQRPREVLPTDVQPTRYRISLTPNIDAATFKGTVFVYLDVHARTSEIVLNAVGLEISASSVLGSDGMQDARVTYDKGRDRAIIAFDRPLEAGTNAMLSMEFTGSLTNALTGLYRSEYTLADGTKATMVTTQFEPVSARRCFPCWDEPDKKAVFEINMIVPEKLTAISNGRIGAETLLGDGKGLKLVEFEETPIMSTYLLAFIVGDLRHITATTPDGIVVRGWATPGKETQCQFSVDLTVKVLAYFAEYFGTRYPLPKVDLIAIPDFLFGAMENWGAITFRETALLIDPVNSSQAARQRVAIVVAHELAHQWFGNLVTMEWWNDLWLNESFATWMATKAVHCIYPEWDLWPQFVADDMAGGLQLDGLRNSHPIDVDIAKAEEVDEVFDAISYDKGGSVLRMLEQHLTEHTFREGLRLYMSRHQYANTRASDLWNALGEAAGDPRLAEMMHTWTRQTGHPTITVSAERTADGHAVTLQQTKFCYVGVDHADPTCWDIPVGLVAANRDGSRGAVTNERFSGKGHNVRLVRDTADDGNDWIHANADRTGFYRVNYDAAGWKALVKAVAAGNVLTTEERFGLQDDAFALSRAGVTSVMTFLDMAAAFRHEPTYAVWSGLAGNLAEVYGLIATDPSAAEGFKGFGRELFADIVARVGWDRKPSDTHADILLRSIVLHEAGRYGDAAVIAEAGNRFARLVDGAVCDPDIRSVIYRLAARTGGAAEHDIFTARYRAETLQEEKSRLFAALASFDSEELLQRTLDFSLSSDVRRQDAFYGISGVATQPRGILLAWRFLRERWSELAQIYGTNPSMLGRFVQYGTGSLSTPQDLADVRTFFAAHPTPGLTRTFEQSLERITINIAWREKNLEDLRDRFSEGTLGAAV